MKRRKFIKTTALGSLVLGVGCSTAPTKTHLITFSFDDGFKKSFYRAAEIHENYGLKACLNVIASGHFPNFKAIDQWIRPELLGNFKDWNHFVSRGHEVMPHTWEHLNLTKIPLDQAKANIDKCLAYFEKNLDGYQTEKAIYNYAFGASNKALDDFVMTRVWAARTGAWWFMKEGETANPIPTNTKPIRIGCWADGPGICDDYLEKGINDFLASPGGWLIFNLHGFDDEGWGPVSTNYYDNLLKRLMDIKHLAILPAGEVLKMVS